MTLNEIAYNLLNLVRGGRSNDDEHISLDQIKFNIKHYRAMFIRRDYARNRLMTNHIEQDLGCIPLERVDASKCCKLPTSCTVYRTTLDIPKTVRFNMQDGITFIGAANGLTTIPRVEPYFVEFLPYDKYTSSKPKAYMIEDRIYIYNPNGMEVINVRGVFEDPEAVANIATCESGYCYDDNTTFPMPMDMVSLITQGMLSGELRLLSATFDDDEQDRQQDKTPIPQQQ